jgi:hypothetical protein
MRDIEGLKGSYNADHKPDNNFELDISGTTSPGGEVNIMAAVNGNGSHSFNIRTSNLSIKDSAKQVNLKPGKKTTLKWHGKTEHPDEPWVAVIVGDNDLSNRKELSGSVWEK